MLINKVLWYILTFIWYSIALFVVALIGGLLLWLLWDSVIPQVFNGPIIDYRQASFLTMLLIVVITVSEMSKEILRKKLDDLD